MATHWTENVLRDCLGLRPGETVLVLTDEVLQPAGEILGATARALAAGSSRSWVLTLPDPRLSVIPDSFLAHVRQADVIVSLFGDLDPWRTSAHLQAAMAEFRASRRSRWAFGVHIDAEAFSRELLSDWSRVARTAGRIASDMGGVGEVHITTEAGTDLALQLGGRPVHRETSLLTEPGAFGNLPGGEVYVAPLEWSAEGRLVVDLSLGGIPLVDPLTLVFREGHVAEISGTAAAELSRRLGDDIWARTLGEFGIGANPYVRPRGTAALDEKALGTAHIALGANRAFGGENTAATHIDCVIRAPHISLDGRPLLL